MLEYQGHSIVHPPSVHYDKSSKTYFVQYQVCNKELTGQNIMFMRRYFEPTTVSLTSTPSFPLVYNNSFYKQHKPSFEIRSWLLDICQITCQFLTTYQLQQVAQVNFTLRIQNIRTKDAFSVVYEYRKLQEKLYKQDCNWLDAFLPDQQGIIDKVISTFDKSVCNWELVGFSSNRSEQITTTEMWVHRLYGMYGWMILTQGKSSWYPTQPSPSLQHLLNHILASTNPPHKGGAQYQFILDKHFHRAIYYELESYAQIKDKQDTDEHMCEFISKCLIAAIPNYLLGVLHEDTQARIGNSTKTKLIDLFDYVCSRIRYHNISFSFCKNLFQSFVEKMLSFRDIRWFLDLILLWACNPVTGVFIEVVPAVMKQHPHLYNTMSRDNTTIVNGLCKKRFSSEDHVKQIILQGNTDSMNKLQTLIGCDLLHLDVYIYALCHNFSPESKVYAWYKHNNKALVSFEQTIRIQDIDKLRLFEYGYGKQRLICDAYEICVKNNWHTQALWIHSLYHIKLEERHLQLALKHQHETFIQEVILSMGLCTDERWITENLKDTCQVQTKSPKSYADDWKRIWLSCYMCGFFTCKFEYVFHEEDFIHQTHCMKYIDQVLADDLKTMLYYKNTSAEEVLDMFVKKASYYNRVVSFKDASNKLPLLKYVMQRFIEPYTFKFSDIINAMDTQPTVPAILKRSFPHLYSYLSTLFHMPRLP